MYKRTYFSAKMFNTFLYFAEFLKIKRADIDKHQKFKRTSFSFVPQISRLSAHGY